MSKKEKLKAWYEKHKREIRDAAWYTAGFVVAFGGIYVAGRLDERKYDGCEVQSEIFKHEDDYGFMYSRKLKNGKPDYNTTQFLSWQKDEAKEVAEKFLELVTEDETKES